MVIKELDTPMNEKANIINLRDELIDVKNSPIFETDQLEEITNTGRTQQIEQIKDQIKEIKQRNRIVRASLNLENSFKYQRVKSMRTFNAVRQKEEKQFLDSFKKKKLAILKLIKRE